MQIEKYISQNSLGSQDANLLLSQQKLNNLSSNLAWEDYDSLTCPESPVRNRQLREDFQAKEFKTNAEIFKDLSIGSSSEEEVGKQLDKPKQIMLEKSKYISPQKHN